MTFLLRYWKPLAALALVVALLFGAYSKGRADASAAWKVKLMDRELAHQKQKLADSEAHVKALEKADAERRAAQKELDRLAKLPPKVIERVRTNPSNCSIPRAVTDGLREQINETNAAIRLRGAAAPP